MLKVQGYSLVLLVQEKATLIFLHIHLVTNHGINHELFNEPLVTVFLGAFP